MSLSSDDIDLFLAVVDHGSFSGAARALRRVPSAVSMGIANIEAGLGYPLFDRSRREALPTAQALALVPHARSVASRLRLLQIHAVELSQDLESTLTVAVAAGVPDEAMLAALAQVGSRYPLLRVNLLRLPQDQVRERLHQEQADLALLPVSTEVDREEAFTHVADMLFVAVASATADTPGLPADLRRLEDLSGSRQIVIAGPDDAVADRRLLVSDARWHVDSVEAALGLVACGAGWANLPMDVVEVAVAAGRVRVLAFDNLANGVTMPVHLVWLRRKPVRRAAGDVIALMRQDPH
ncbi:LysR family transcriptional regulator [Stenotrophomonas sp. TWI587]|uniref:LysR family transcriptional regulator n=1 Tax=Stenotrophomonas sp. TWI587 TaxID=3136783 RepID=UPI0032096AA1